MKIKEIDLNENMVTLYDAIGEDNFLKVVRLFGGSNVYIPTHKSVLKAGRDREIVRRYNGVNKDILAREYELSSTQISNIVQYDK